MGNSNCDGCGGLKPRVAQPEEAKDHNEIPCKEIKCHINDPEVEDPEEDENDPPSATESDGDGEANKAVEYESDSDAALTSHMECIPKKNDFY